MTYGRVKYAKPKDIQKFWWVVQCEPHVRARLKRLFPRAPQHAAEFITISNTPENARDLLWFLERYPMEVDRLDLLKEFAAEHVRTEERIADLMAQRRPPLTITLAKPARDYQAFSAQMLEIKRGLLLADDVGLGKTVTAICSMTMPENLPAVVVCPTHMPPQWAAMVAEFAPELTVHILKKGQPYPLTRGIRRGQLELLDDRLPDVIISNYHKLRGWAETLAGVARMVVFDECQQLRSPSSNIYFACDHLAEKTPLRLGLSATPIYNYGSEFFHVVDVLLPGALGEHSEFIREWCMGQRGDKARIADTEQFGAYLRREGIMLRRTRQEVGRELPELTKVVHMVESDTAALDDLKGDAIELAKIVVGHNERYRGEKMNAAGKFDSLMRQATGIAKAPYVAEFVKLLLDSEDRIVLFGWHREVYNIWLERLKEFDPVLYTGTESVNQKTDAKDAFLSGKSRILIMSLRSGAGVDGLQGSCRTAVFGELDWSPGVHEQCLSADTEILTREGWRGVSNLQPSDAVAGFNLRDGSVDWCDVQKVVRRPLGDEAMYSLTSPTLDLRVTAGHRMVYRFARGVGKRKRSGWEITTAADLAVRSQGFAVPVAGVQSAPGVALTDDQLRLIGWFVTDGSLNRRSRQLMICQAEASPFNAAIRSCLTGCGLRWTVARTAAGTGSQFNRRSALLRYCIPKHGAKQRGVPGGGWATLEPYLDKDLSPLLNEMTAAQLRVFLEAVHMGDGWKQTRQSWTRRSYHIGTGRLLFAERLQSLCVRRGWRANIAERRTPTRSKHWTLHMREESARAVGGTSHSKDRPVFSRCESDPAELVWCVQNRLGTIIVRRNGKVAVVGNCVGRIHRDGQPEPCVAYFLTAEDGADPIMVDVLGIKREQIEGVRNPNRALAERVDTGENSIRRLAREFLIKRGVKVKEERELSIEKEAS